MNQPTGNRIFIAIILAVLFSSINAQERIPDGWKIFYDTYDWVPGSTLVDMQLIHTSPKPEMPFVVIAGSEFSNCTSDGFPNDFEYQHLFNLSDSIMRVITSHTRAILTGTFTCQCKRTDYIYVNDTTGLRLELYKLYNRSFKGYAPQLWIKPDTGWAAYRTFLYPSEKKLETLINDSIAKQLQAMGDNITLPRMVDHYLYFKTKNDRKLFIAYALEQKFIITGQKKVKHRPDRFQLCISKSDFIEPEHFTYTTLELKHKAKEFNGNYDTWKCAIVK